MRREIKPVLGDRWCGWQAFRRGLVGILFEAGVDVEVAKVILRHSDSATTRRHYLVLKSRKEGKAGMKTLEKILTVRDKRGTAKTNKKRKSRAYPHEQRVKSGADDQS
jgi:hypothetical protein